MLNQEKASVTVRLPLPVDHSSKSQAANVVNLPVLQQVAVLQRAEQNEVGRAAVHAEGQLCMKPVRVC